MSTAAPSPGREVPRELLLLGALVLCLVLIPVHIHRAFGLPAHPLLLHFPVVLVPVLGLAVLALAARPGWLDRHGVPAGAFGVVTAAATILTAGAGQAFEDDRSRVVGGAPASPQLAEHADAGETLRLVVLALVAVLLVAGLARRAVPDVAPMHVALRLALAVLAVTAIFLVIRTGHLGAELTWG
jgi:uncharacterized membrane protein